MSLRQAPGVDVSPGYGGCACICHQSAHVRHGVPCCSAADECAECRAVQHPGDAGAGRHRPGCSRAMADIAAPPAGTR